MHCTYSQIFKSCYQMLPARIDPQAVNTLLLTTLACNLLQDLHLAAMPDPNYSAAATLSFTMSSRVTNDTTSSTPLHAVGNALAHSSLTDVIPFLPS